MIFRVITHHTAIYLDPIVVAKGDPIRLTGRENRWDGHLWLWAEAADGRAGWVPDTIAMAKDSHTIAKYNYSAHELTCALGDRLSSSEQTHGWAWCRNSQGQQGWVPIKNLQLA